MSNVYFETLVDKGQELGWWMGFARLTKDWGSGRGAQACAHSFGLVLSDGAQPSDPGCWCLLWDAALGLGLGQISRPGRRAGT